MNTNTEICRSCIGLFKKFPVSYKEKLDVSDTRDLFDCLKWGFIVVDREGTPIKEIPTTIFNFIDEFYGCPTMFFNTTLHKSFETVASMNPLEYAYKQLLHYFTAYTDGIPTYLPTEKLNIPNCHFMKEKLTVIQEMPLADIKREVEAFVKKVVSPSTQQVELFRSLTSFAEVEDIKSFELKIIKYEAEKTLPIENELMMFRYLLYKTIRMTYAIKNEATIKAIEMMDADAQDAAVTIFMSVEPKVWARIFYRYKPIFLAYRRCIPQLHRFINKIRREANTNHRPLNNVCVQNITKLFAEERLEDYVDAVLKASNRDIIKILNSLIQSESETDLIKVYNIRNGTTFVDTSEKKFSKAISSKIVFFLINVLRNRLENSIKGKIFYIPDYISYAAPTSEKQFVGNIPWGSYVNAPKKGAFVTGIQWFNNFWSADPRVDFDLHMNSATRHFGWNGHHCAEDTNIIFTGDVIDAPTPNGAAEAYYFNPKDDDNFIISVNLFHGELSTPFKFGMSTREPVFSRQKNDFIFKDFMFPPIPLQMPKNRNSLTIGMFAGRKFYFYGGSLDSGIVPSKHYENYVNGIKQHLFAKVSLYELITWCGGSILSSLPNNLSDIERKEIIDLSPEALTSQSLLDIVDGNLT